MSIFSKYAKTFETEATQRNIRVRVLSTHRDKVSISVVVVKLLLLFGEH